MNKEIFRKIETFKDLELEKERLNLQIQLAEERINNNFNSLTNKLTLGSITSQIKESAIGSIYKAFRVAYYFFSRKRKNNY